MGFRRGQTVVCTDAPDYLRGAVKQGKFYVVNGLELHHEQEYLVILGDDDRRHVLLASMFEARR